MIWEIPSLLKPLDGVRFLAGNSMALAYNVGCTPEEAFEVQKDNQTYCLASNPKLLNPSAAYAPAPLGIDIRQVAAKKKVFLINTGIAHKDAGHSVVARGLLFPPMEAFDKATKDYCAKYDVTVEDLVATL